MLEVMTGLVLASAAGLNAYIPMLGLGLLAKFTPLITLPENWAWISNDWMLVLLGVLLFVEVLVDKFPVLDSINDVLQTVVRPASGGMVFAAGIGSETVAVSDPDAFLSSDTLWPVLIGIGVALVPHILKSLARPILNVLTGGAGAAVASTFEDIGAAVLTVLAVLVPLLAIVLVFVTIWWLARRLRRARETRRARRETGAAGSQPLETV